jgi:hypothetical protein
MAKITKEDLQNIRADRPDFFQQSSELKYQDMVEREIEKIEKQSDAFASIIKQMNVVSSDVYEASNRKENILAGKSLGVIEQLITNNKSNITDKEKMVLDDLLREMKMTNQSLKENEHSLRAAFSDSLKSNLPSIAGILGTIGLDNPAFLFIGSMMQSMMDKRKQADEKREKILQDQHKDVLAAELKRDKEAKDPITQKREGDQRTEKIVETIDRLQERYDNADPDDPNAEKMLSTLEKLREMYAIENGQLIAAQDENRTAVQEGNKLLDLNTAEIQTSNLLLDHLSNSINTLVKNSEASGFAEIEKQREDNRRTEKMIEAINNIDNGSDMNLADATDKQNSLLQILGLNEMFQSFMMGLAGIGAFFSKAGAVLKSGGKLLLKGVARFAGPVGLAVTAFYAVTDGIDGWNNAAEKLGKDVATTTDKMASAIGGTLGGIAGIADSLFGLVGIETDIGGFVDQKVTEFLASYYDMIKGTIDRIKNFFTNIFSISFPEGFSLTELIKAPYRLMWNWWKTVLNLDGLQLGDISVAEFVETKVSELIGSVKNVFNNITASAKEGLDFIIEATKEAFTFDFEIPDIKEIVSDFFGKIFDIFKNFSVVDLIKGSIPFFKDDEKLSVEQLKPEKSSNIIDDLEDKKVIDKRMFRNDVITDWDAINDLNRKQIANLMEYDDFDEETRNKLKDILGSKSDVMMGAINPRSNLSTKSAEYLNQEASEREKTNKNVVVNSPKTSNVNNINKTQNSYNVQASPHQEDITLRQLNTNFGF